MVRGTDWEERRSVVRGVMDCCSILSHLEGITELVGDSVCGMGEAKTEDALGTVYGVGGVRVTVPHCSEYGTRRRELHFCI